MCDGETASCDGETGCVSTDDEFSAFGPDISDRILGVSQHSHRSEALSSVSALLIGV